MTIEKKTEFEIEHKFDAAHCRHYLNGICSVLHCHHYATLYTQLACDAEQFDGIRLLTETAEDVFYEVLQIYFTDKDITSPEDKAEITRQYWQAVGMGIIRFTGIGKYEVIAEMDYSHIDEGWLKKWGSHNTPINFFTSGFVSAAAALFNNKASRSFQTRETKSLVCGDGKSVFKAVLK